MFKIADKKIAKLGFNKIRENQYGVIYEREDTRYGFTQVVELLHKQSGRHILSSYDKNLGDNECIGNTCVGLTSGEIKAFYRKMKEQNLLCRRAQHD